MKWYNETQTASLDLDKIVYWEYNSSIQELKLWIGGSNPIRFQGMDAEEIYKMLTSRKEVL